MRLVKANDLDLTLFQFDYDLTFAVFFMNADKTIYGRYGSRSSIEHATSDISLAGLAAAMSGALAIHNDYPNNRERLQGKQAVASNYQTPDDFPALRGKYKSNLDYDGSVAKSCLHCHQIRDAARQVYRDNGKPIPDRVMFPNPLPDVIGLHFDPATAATVQRVALGSSAATAGFQSGDELMSLDGQPILSLADVQWVLHNAEATDTLAAVVRRGGQKRSLQVRLRENWRRNTDIAWRVSSWSLRRMGTGGLLFEAAMPDQRRAAGVGTDELALVVKHVGQYGDHGAAKRAGFEKGDILVSFDGRNENMTTSQLLAYAAQNTKPGDSVSATVVRDGDRLTLSLPMQK